MILAGSCSDATRGQIAEYAKSGPVLRLVIDATLHRTDRRAELVDRAIDWIEQHHDRESVLVATDSGVAEAVREFGREPAARLVESLMARIALRAVARGTQRLIIAGGETSGAIVKALGIQAIHIGPEIAPGYRGFITLEIRDWRWR